MRRCPGRDFAYYAVGKERTLSSSVGANALSFEAPTAPFYAGSLIGAKETIWSFSHSTSQRVSRPAHLNTGPSGSTI